jgi:putative flippase GtrA
MLISQTKQCAADLQEFRQRLKESGWRSALRWVSCPHAPASWQSLKYLFIGGLSVVVFYAAYGAFRYLSGKIIPGVFTDHRILCNMLGIMFAFIPTNLFTYHTNRMWVFVSGKHEKQKEFLLFTSAAAISLGASQLLVFLLIMYTKINDFAISLGVIVLSTFVNYFVRKFLVFHR